MGLEDFTTLPKYHRRTFVALIFIMCMVLIATAVPLHFYGGNWGEFAFLVIMHILSGIVASAVVIGFIYFFIPKGQRSDQVVEVPPTKIGHEFTSLLKDAHRWFYSGNFGRYLRSRVLRDLSSRTGVDVDVYILDPRIEPLCQQHAEYRNQIRTADGKSDYTAEDVALQAVVTVVYCGWYTRNRGMAIDLFLTKAFDPVRIDASDDAMILTVEDRQRPALKLSRGHFMFDHFMLELKYLATQASRLNVSGFPAKRSLQEITSEDVATFLGALEMKELCDRLTAEKIVSEVHLDRNPYEK